MHTVVPSSSSVDAASAPADAWIGDYRLLVEIAEDDLGVILVARARNAAPDSHPVAIHRYHAEIAADPEFRRLLTEELAAVAMLAHPNVLAPREVIQVEPLSIVMELLDGGSFALLMQNTRAQSKCVPVPIVLRVLVDVLNGLHAANEMFGIVHKGLSPHAVFVGEDGIGRITEIGLARARSYAAASSERDIDEHAAYKAPEQFDSRPITAVADVYSAAEVLWEALAGRPRFGGGSVAASLKGRAQITPPSQVTAGVSRELDAIVLKALATAPAERYESAAEFARALIACGVALASKDEVGAYVRAMFGAANATRRARWSQVQVAPVPIRDVAPAPAATMISNSVAVPRPAERVSPAPQQPVDAKVASAARAAWSASWEAAVEQPTADKTGARPAAGKSAATAGARPKANPVRLPAPGQAPSPAPSAQPSAPTTAKEEAARTFAPPPRSSAMRGATRPGLPVSAAPSVRVGTETPASVTSVVRAPTPAPFTTAPEKIVQTQVRANPTATIAPSAQMHDPPAALANATLNTASAAVDSASRSKPLVGNVPLAAVLSEPAPVFDVPIAEVPATTAAPVVPLPPMASVIATLTESPLRSQNIVAPAVSATAIATPAPRQSVAVAQPVSRTMIDGTPAALPSTSTSTQSTATDRPVPLAQLAVASVVAKAEPTRAPMIAVPASSSARTATDASIDSKAPNKLPLTIAAIGTAIVVFGSLWLALRSDTPRANAVTTMAPASVQARPSSETAMVPAAMAPSIAPSTNNETAITPPVVNAVSPHQHGSGRASDSILAPTQAPVVEPAPVPAGAPAPRRRRREYRPGTV